MANIRNIKSQVEANGGIGPLNPIAPDAPSINVDAAGRVSVPKPVVGTSAAGAGGTSPASGQTVVQDRLPGMEAFFVSSDGATADVLAAPTDTVGGNAQTMGVASGYDGTPIETDDAPAPRSTVTSPQGAPAQAEPIPATAPAATADQPTVVGGTATEAAEPADTGEPEIVIERTPATDDGSLRGRMRRKKSVVQSPGKPMEEKRARAKRAQSSGRLWQGRRKDSSPEVQELINAATAPGAAQDTPTLSNKPVPGALTRIKGVAVDATKAMFRGSAIAREITGNPKLQFSDVSLPVDMMVHQLRNEPESYLAEILQEYNPGIDLSELLRDDAIAETVIYHTFEKNVIYGLVEKTVHDETTTHRRRIRVSFGPSVEVNPLIAKQFNADFDGDQLKVSYQPEVVRMGKSPMAYLLGTEGGLRIDPDFMALLPLYGDIELVMDEVLGMVDGLVFNERHRDQIKSAFTQAWTDDAELGLKNLLTAIVEASVNMHGDTEEAYEVAGSALETIYQMNEKILRASNLIKKAERSEEKVQAAMKAFADGAITAGNFTEILADPAPNSIAAQANINAPSGMSDGRNVQFRITAGLGKLVRLSTKILGQDAEPTKLARRTFLHILALQMSNVREFEEVGTDLNRMIDKWILDMVPDVPGNKRGEKFSEFTKGFSAAGRNVAMIINSAGAKQTTEGKFSKSDDFYMKPVVTPGDFGKELFDELTDEEKRTVTDSFRKMFRQVYGSMKMRHLFGKNPLIDRYRDMTLNEFIYRCDFTVKETGRATDNVLDDVDALIYRLADMGTSYANKVGKAFEDMADAQFIHKKGVTKLADGAASTPKIGAILYRMSQAEDSDMYLEDLELLVESIRDIWPEMFDFLGLNSPFAFKETALGRKFINARTKDQFKAALLEAVIRYKFDPIFNARRSMKLAEEAGQIDTATEAEELLNLELAALADTGYTWQLIVDMYRDDANVLNRIFLGDDGGTKIINDLAQLVVDGAYRARYTKDQVIADIFTNPKNPSSDDRFTYGEGHGTLLKNLKSSANRVSTYDRYGIYQLKQDVEVAKLNHGDHIVTFFWELAADQSYFTAFSEKTVVDSVAAIMEKTHDQTEKAQQTKIARFLYSAVSYIKNGGVFSHMTFGGDLSVNEMSLEKFKKSPWLLAKILTDPSFSLNVYDEFGRISEVSMLTVLGVRQIGPDHADLIWKWMENNPRAAAAFRISGTASGIGEDGGDYTVAETSLSDSIDRVLKMSPAIQENREAQDRDPILAREMYARRGMVALANRPGFYSLVALTMKMDAERRFQARNNALYGPDKKMTGTNVARIIEIIRGYYDQNGIVNNQLIENDVEMLFRRRYTPGEIDAMNYLLEKKEEQDERKKAGERIPESKDVTLEPLYQIAQVKSDMAKNLKRYAADLARENARTQIRNNGALVSDGRIPPTDYVNGPAALGMTSQADLLGDLFLVDNPATIRAYFNVAETISNVKTELDTGVNGSESRNYVSLMFLADLVAEPCDAPDPTESITIDEFSQNWHKYTDRVARINDNLWVPIGAATFERVAELSVKRGDGQIWLEDPGRCTSGSCPCKRHSVADQATNFYTKQTSPLVRLLTIVRTLAAEGLNLKSKTKGVDDLDSVVKNEIDNTLYREVSMGIKAAINDRFRETLAETGDQSEALKAARLMLAEHMNEVFRSMQYTSGEMRINDFVNVAQTMIKVVDAGTDQASVVVLSLGRINAIVGSAIERLRVSAREAGVELKHNDYLAAAEAAIERFDPAVSTTTARSLLFRMKVPKVSPMANQVRSDWNNSTTRRVDAISDILENMPARLRPLIASEQKLDTAEGLLMSQILASLDSDDPLLSDHENIVHRWRSFTARGTRYDQIVGVRKIRGPEDRIGLRITGLYLPGDNVVSSLKGVGDQNVVIVSAESDHIVQVIADAYYLGNTVIIDGEPSDKIWDEVSRRTNGFIDANQGAFVESDPNFKGETTLGYYLPMLDLRMNGRNTTDRMGGHNIGVYSADGEKSIKFWVESIINPHRAGDAEFIATLSAKMTEHFRPGEYTVDASDLFHNALKSLSDEPAARKIIPQRPDASLVVGIAGSEKFASEEAFRAYMEDHLLAYQEGRIKKILVTNATRTQAFVSRWANAVGIPVEIVKSKGAGTESFTERDLRFVEQSDMIVTFTAETPDRYDHAETIEEKARFKSKRYAQIDHRGNRRIFGPSPSTGQWARSEPKFLESLYDREVNPLPVSGIELVTVVPTAEVSDLIVPAIRAGSWGGMLVDSGTPQSAESDTDRIRLSEQLVRFADRVDSGALTEGGWLDSVKPGEIVAILKLEVNGATVYHPLRAYEHANASGAPTNMQVSGISFDEATGRVTVKWTHAGNMLGRFFKIFEYGNASTKLMARPEHIPDITLADGTKLFGYLSKMSTATRRLEWRRTQKMQTLIYKSRLQPFGYNIAESGGLPFDPELREMVRTGNSDIAAWADRLEGNEIVFFGDEEIDRIMNYMANRCVKFGVDPSIMFASHHYVPVPGTEDSENPEHVFAPNNMWFDFQVLLGADTLMPSIEFMDGLMKMMHRMNPTLCPEGVRGAYEPEMLFNNDLQVFMPIEEVNGETYGEWVDMFGGPHFMDNHYYGYSASGTRVSSIALASLPALMAGGAKLTHSLLEKLLDWGNLGVENRRTSNRGIVTYAEDPEE